MLEPIMMKKAAGFLDRRRYEYVKRSHSRSGRMRMHVLKARVDQMPICRLRKSKKEDFDYAKTVITGTGMGPAFQKQMNLEYWQKPRKVIKHTPNFRLSLLLMYPSLRGNNAKTAQFADNVLGA